MGKLRNIELSSANLIHRSTGDGIKDLIMCVKHDTIFIEFNGGAILLVIKYDTAYPMYGYPEDSNVTYTSLYVTLIYEDEVYQAFHKGYEHYCHKIFVELGLDKFIQSKYGYMI